MTIRKAPFFAYFPKKTCSECGRVFIFESYWKVPVAPTFFQGCRSAVKIVCQDCYDRRSDNE